MSLFLDPRLKDLKFMSLQQQRKTHKLVRNRTNCLAEEDDFAQQLHPTDFFSQIAQQSASAPGVSRTDFQRYWKDLGAVPSTKGFCTMQWWRDNRVLFLVLAGVARSVFGSRPTFMPGGHGSAWGKIVWLGKNDV